MQIFLNSLIESFLNVAPYILVFLVVFETIAAIMSTTIISAAFHVFAAFVNGFVLYYHQTRGNI